MNLAIFWRLLWKEYRLQRALWISMAVLTALFLWLLNEVLIAGPDKPLWLYGFALGFPACYALGCGAMLFAGEHENSTYQFQRALPITSLRLMAGKITFALLSTALMAGLMWSVAAYSVGWMLPPDPWAVWAMPGFCAVELLLWAMLFSLLLKRVVPAAILGVAAASISVHSLHSQFSPGFVMDAYVQAMPWRVAVAALVALADVWLGARWLRERSGRVHRPSCATACLQAVQHCLCEAVAHREASFDRFGRPERMAMLWRLVWQQWRQSRWVVLALAALTVPLAIGAIQLWISVHTGEFSHLEVNGRATVYVGIMLAMLTVPLMGSCVFLADQQGYSFRFLADRGVPPRYVWLSRQFGALAAGVFSSIAILVALALLLVVAFWAPKHPYTGYATEPLILSEVSQVLALGLALLCYLVVGITAGQLCSMFFRGGVLAGFFGLLLTCLLSGWCAVMWLWGVNWLWSVAPIPIVLLLATWLRAPDWLLERNNLRAWLRPGLAMAVPVAVVFTAVPLVRIHGVPVVDPGFSPDEYARPATPEEQATLDLYERAWAHYTKWENVAWESSEEESSEKKVTEKQEEPPEMKPPALSSHAIAWIDANQEAIGLILQASRRKECDFFDPEYRKPTQDHVRDLAGLLISSAAALEEEGKLDAALEQYLAAIRISVQLRQRSGGWYADHVEHETYLHLPYWATRPGQTPERVIAAARQLEQLTANLPAGADTIKSDYIRVRRVLSGDFSTLGEVHGAWLPLTMLWLRLPWEGTRALRLLNLLTREELDVVSEAELAARQGKAIPQPPHDDSVRKQKQRYTFELIAASPINYYGLWDTTWLVREYSQMETRRRAVRLLLALEAWKLKHGSLPETLDELVGPYLDHLPVDPYAGAPFRYVRDGVKIPLHCSPPDTANEKIAANVPFLWSTGARIAFTPDEKKSLDQYRIIEYSYGRRELREPKSEYDVWEAGWPFPIP